MASAAASHHHSQQILHHHHHGATTSSSTGPQKFIPFRTTMGLLTTVEQLPPKYKIRYLARTIESPLDLSIKQDDDALDRTIVDCSSPKKSNNIQQQHPMTPPPSPPKKRYRDEDFTNKNEILVTQPPPKLTKNELQLIIKKNEKKITSDAGEITPKKPIRLTSSVPKTTKTHPNVPKEKKSKAIRKLKFDEETSSPVSGTIIRPLEEVGADPTLESGDIDPEYNIVEVTEEAKAELAIIKNVIGAYVCKLCRLEFEDAFGLARHRCSCIVLLEYRCPECSKRFNCPANLASHRRWHKPKDQIFKNTKHENRENEPNHRCTECGKTFKRQAYLRKHMLTHKNVLEDEVKKNKDTIDQQSTTSTGETEASVVSSTLYQRSTDDSNSRMTSSSLSHHSSISHPYQDDPKRSKFYRYDSDFESHQSSSSACSSPGRLRICENDLTEEENIAAAALAHLRNGPSVIQHTTGLAF